VQSPGAIAREGRISESIPAFWMQVSSRRHAVRGAVSLSAGDRLGGQQGAVHLRQSSHHGLRRHGLLFPTDSVRPGRQQAHVQDRQEARLGRVQQFDRQPDRHPILVPGRVVFEDRHQRQRWHRNEVAACVLDQGSAGDVDLVTGNVVVGAPNTECRRHPA